MTQKIKNVPLTVPYLGEEETKAVTEVVEKGWISSAGDKIDSFEIAFSTKHGATFGAACSSGTNALVLALRALGVKEGDEVIVPNFTMVATAWAVSMIGATPVFVDCQYSDLNIDPKKIEEAITEKTKAIIAVHVYGRVADMDSIMEIGYEYGLRVIEDSAEAHGTPLRGDIACFSLYGNKIITTGEGGICITDDPYLDAQMKHLRGMAFNKDHTFLHKKFAYNFRMTNMQAAVGVEQVKKLEVILKKRKEIESWYDEELKELDSRADFFLMPERDSVWFYDIRTSPKKRDELVEFLKENGVDSRVYFKPMNQQPMYLDMYHMDLAYKMSLEGLYLPTFTSMTKQDVKYVADKIKEFYALKESEESKEVKRGEETQGAQKQEG